MSRTIENGTLSRKVVKAFVTLYFGDYKTFCERYNIRQTSFNTWMQGVETMPKINKKVVKAMNEYQYPIQHAYNPDLKLMVAGE